MNRQVPGIDTVRPVKINSRKTPINNSIEIVQSHAAIPSSRRKIQDNDQFKQAAARSEERLKDIINKPKDIKKLEYDNKILLDTIRHAEEELLSWALSGGKNEKAVFEAKKILTEGLREIRGISDSQINAENNNKSNQ